MNFGGELIFHAIHTLPRRIPAPFFGSDSTDKEYLADLVDASFRAIRRAYKNLAPAELFCAKENNNPLAFNRRYFMKNGKVVTNPGKLNPDIVKPEGPVDEEITVMGNPSGRTHQARFLQTSSTTPTRSATISYPPTGPAEWSIHSRRNSAPMSRYP